MNSLNRAFTRLQAKRRYESWFLRFGLADGNGTWWLRYLLTNPGRNGCAMSGGSPGQVWATWFPRDGAPQAFIQEFPIADVKLASRSDPFSLEIGSNCIRDNSCRGSIAANGQQISWNLQYSSRFSVTLSNKGWIGFSRTPHSDAIFSGEIRGQGAISQGSPLGMGVQGHNCGFRHRNFWTWTHACFPQQDGSLSTLEALVYEMPLGFRFRKAVLWHKGQQYIWRRLQESVRDPHRLKWNFYARSRDCNLLAEIDGSGASIHRLPYVKTDCSGTFEVSNNSRSRIRVTLDLPTGRQEFSSENDSVLEMTGDY